MPAAAKSKHPWTAKKKPVTSIPAARTSIDAAFADGGWKSVYHADRLQRVAAIQQGIHASALIALAGRMGRPVSAIGQSLGFASSTLRRKASIDQKLSPSVSERIIGLASLIGQVEAMVGNDRPADFDAAKWVAGWVEQPHPALGGGKPEKLLDTATGQSLVSDLLGSAASGAYW